MSEISTIESNDDASTKIPIDLWGQLGSLTPAQELALVEFRKAVPEEHVNIMKYTVESVDQVSLRFLRARQFDVGKALTLMQEAYNKKLEGQAKKFASMSADEAADCDIAVLRKFYPHAQRGFDKNNRPLLFERDGKTDCNPMFILFGKEQFLSYHYWSMDHALDQMFCESAERFYGANKTEKVDSATGDLSREWDIPSPVIVSTLAVLDLNGFGLAHCSSKMLELIKGTVSIDNVVYPEMLGKMIVINAPWLAVQTWGMVKGWLDPRTQAKIEIIGPGSDSIKRLHELISPEYLPAEFAGTAPDLYYTKPNTEYIQLAKGSEVTRTIDVPFGKTLFIDTYVGEGLINVTVFSSNASGPMSAPISTPSSPEKKSFFSRSAKSTVSSIHGSMGSILDQFEMKFTCPLNSGRGRTRVLKKYFCDNTGLPSNVTHKSFKVTWKTPANDSYFSGGKVGFIYSFTISDTPEFPDMLSVIDKHTSLKSYPQISVNISDKTARHRSSTIAVDSRTTTSSNTSSYSTANSPTVKGSHSTDDMLSYDQPSNRETSMILEDDGEIRFNASPQGHDHHTKEIRSHDFQGRERSESSPVIKSSSFATISQYGTTMQSISRPTSTLQPVSKTESPLIQTIDPSDLNQALADDDDVNPNDSPSQPSTTDLKDDGKEEGVSEIKDALKLEGVNINDESNSNTMPNDSEMDSSVTLTENHLDIPTEGATPLDVPETGVDESILSPTTGDQEEG